MKTVQSKISYLLASLFAFSGSQVFAACIAVNGPYSINTTSTNCYSWNSGNIDIGSSASIAPSDLTQFTFKTTGSAGNLTNDGSIYNNTGGINDVSPIGVYHNTSAIINNGLIQNNRQNFTILLRAGTLSTLTNSGQIINTGSYDPITGGAWGAIGFVQNFAQVSSGSITNFNNLSTGLISGGSGGDAIDAQNYGSIANLNNAGSITTNYGIAIAAAMGGTISNIVNSGTISNTGTAGGFVYWSANDGGTAIYNSGRVVSITNTGSIYTTAAGGVGIYNNTNTASDTVGRIGTLNNLQGVGNMRGALTYSGTLPTNYNIIINSPSNFGQLAVTGPLSSTTFGIHASSILSTATYNSVLTGITSSNIANYGSIFNTWNSFNSSYKWQLVQGNISTAWNLIVSSISSNLISGSGSVYQSPNVGVTVDPVFDGGTLKVSGAGPITQSFTINSNNGVIDQNGVVSNFTGNISNNGAGDNGKLTIINTGAAGSGTVNLYGINTHSGGTEVQAGANLSIASSAALGPSALSLVGSATVSATLSTTATMTISNPITVSGDPTFNVAPGTITTITSPITDGISSGDVVADGGGTLALTAVNTYTGSTTITPGSTLALSGSGAIAQSNLVTNNGNLDISASTIGATVNALTGSGAVALGTKNLSIANANGSFSGSIGGSGNLAITSGIQTLSGTNTYTGSTTITPGSTLALFGSGAIAQSKVVTNNGNFNITGNTANVSVANFTQSSSGTLAMNISPTTSNTQKLLVAGAASLAGGLSLTGSAGAYRPGRYSLLTANGVLGTFASFSSNLSSLTRLGYSLAYDASNVYLVFTSNVADTQQSLVNTASALQNIYTLQNSVLANSFSYDCNEFGANGICISAGGRNTAVSAANGLNNTSGLLIGAYRPHQNYRVGAYIDQNLSMNNASATVNLGNNTPLVGLFSAWNQNTDGTGAEVKLSAAYGQKNTTVTRSVVGTSEPGSGSSQLNSQGAQVTAKYGFSLTEKVIVSPYVGIRYTQNNMGGYTEGASSTVTVPLTYSALNTNATTALAGLGTSYKVTPVVTTFASAGVETDTNTTNGTYSATGINGLTPINFNANPVKTRPTATLGAYYDLAKNQRLGITGIYRKEPYQAVSTTTVMATYMIGL